MKKLVILTLIAGVAGALSACGGGSSGGGTTIVTVPPTQTSPQAKFGAKFDAAFHADANSAPASVSPGDVVPVDPAATPSAVK